MNKANVVYLIWGGVVMLLMMITVMVVVKDFANTKTVTVIVDIENEADPFQSLPRTSLTDRVISVKRIDATNNKYQVKIRTTRSKEGLLDWLSKKDKVESAIFEEDE